MVACYEGRLATEWCIPKAREDYFMPLLEWCFTTRKCGGAFITKLKSSDITFVPPDRRDKHWARASCRKILEWIKLPSEGASKRVVEEHRSLMFSMENTLGNYRRFTKLPKEVRDDKMEKWKEAWEAEKTGKKKKRVTKPKGRPKAKTKATAKGGSKKVVETSSEDEEEDEDEGEDEDEEDEDEPILELPGRRAQPDSEEDEEGMSTPAKKRKKTSAGKKGKK